MARIEMPSNSNHISTPQKTEEKKTESIVEGKVVKPGLGQRIVSAFLNEDIKSTPEHILFDIMIPAAQNLIVDTAVETVQQIFGGGVRRSSTPSRGSYTSYSSPSRITVRDHSRPERRADPKKTFDNVVLSSRKDAENVLDALGDIMDQYDIVTVADFYDLCSVTPDYTDDAWGWDDLRSASIRRRNDGYIIDMPRPKGIDR